MKPGDLVRAKSDYNTPGLRTIAIYPSAADWAYLSAYPAAAPIGAIGMVLDSVPFPGMQQRAVHAIFPGGIVGWCGSEWLEVVHEAR